MCSFSSVSIVMAHWTSLDCASTASLIHLKTVSKVMGASLASSSDWNLCPGYWFLQKRVHLKCHKFINLEQMVRVATCWNCVVSSFQTNPDHVPGCPRMSQDVPGCPRIKIDLNLTHFKKQARQAMNWHASAFAIAPASRGALLRPARGPLVQQET